MKFRRALAVGATCAAGLALAGLPARPAAAVTLPLFGFHQSNTLIKEFSYTNSTGSFSAVGTISFTGDDGGLPSGMYQLAFIGHATGAVIAGITQPVVITQFTATKTTTGDVLTVATAGTLFLTKTSSSTAAIGASDDIFGNPITYTSSLNGGQPLNTNPPGYPLVTARDYQIGLSGVATGFSVGGNGNYNSFVAQITGSGNFTSSVPEPGALATLMGIGVSGSLFTFRLRRRGARA